MKSHGINGLKTMNLNLLDMFSTPVPRFRGGGRMEADFHKKVRFCFYRIGVM